MDLPKTPEEAVWAQLWNKQTNVYRGSRPDALDSFSTKQWAKEVGAQLAAKTLYVEYEEAVREQKRELKEAKARAKARVGSWSFLTRRLPLDFCPVQRPLGNGPVMLVRTGKC